MDCILDVIEGVGLTSGMLRWLYERADSYFNPSPDILSMLLIQTITHQRIFVFPDEYEVRVEACAGTSSARVNAYFCSHVWCDGTIGDEVEVLLTMSDEEGGWTYTTFSADFNPVAITLVEVEDQDVTW